MYICPKCQKITEAPSNFCSNCGAIMVELPGYVLQQPPSASSYSAPAPVFIVCQPEKKVSIAKVIAGMVLAIVGAAILLFTMAVAFSEIETTPEAAFAACLVFGGASFPLSMVGFTLSKGAINNGCKSSMARVGKILGLIGWIATLACIAGTFVVSIVNNM